MASILNFPASPTVGQQFTVGFRTWTWSGNHWANNTATGVQGTQGIQGAQGTQGITGGLTESVTFTEGTSIPSAADIDDCAIGAGVFFKITGTTASTITGFTGGAAGRFIIIVNNADKNQTFSQENSASSASNRLLLGYGHASRAISAGHSATFIYMTGLIVGGVGSQSRWVLTATTS
jgi:hypothetical protein